jgi:hypothetical protein
MVQNNFTLQRVMYTTALFLPLLAIHYVYLNLVKFCHRNCRRSRMVSSLFRRKWDNPVHRTCTSNADKCKPLTLSDPIFLPPAYFPALIYFGQERGWWITCNYPTVLKEKNINRNSTTCTICWPKSVLHEENKWNRKIIMLDEVQNRIGKG